MGVVDEYEPIPTLQCPVCDTLVAGLWQGKDGPEANCLFQQGDRVGDDLPASFEISQYDDNGHRVAARCEVVDGIWTSARVVDVRVSRAKLVGYEWVVLWSSEE